MNYDDEAKILGCILKDESTLEVVADALQPEDLYHDDLRRLYRLLLARGRAGQGVDSGSVVMALSTMGNEGALYPTWDEITRFEGLPGSVAALPAWLNEAKRASTRRRVREVGEQLANLEAQGFDDESVVRRAQEAIKQLEQATSRQAGDFTNGQWLTISQRIQNSGRSWLQPPPRRRWVLQRADEDAPGFLPRGKVGMLAAAGGTGKTQALLQLAFSVALPREAHQRRTDRYGWFSREIGGGRGWHAPYHVADGGRVLCVLGEEDEEELQRRVYKVARSYGFIEGQMDADEQRWLQAAFDRLVLVPGAGNTHLALTSGSFAAGGTQATSAARSMVSMMNKTGSDWALVILDPLSRFAAGDSETDNREATALVQAAEMLCKVHGNPAVLLAHHTSQDARKSGSIEAHAARGVTALTDGIRWQTNMAPREHKPNAPRLIRFGLSKTNYTKPAPPIDLTWTPEGTLGRALQDEREKYENASTKADEKALKAAEKAPQKPRDLT